MSSVYNLCLNDCIYKLFCHKGPPHLAGSAVPVEGGTGQETGAGGRGPTPAAVAAAAAECPFQ